MGGKNAKQMPVLVEVTFCRVGPMRMINRCASVTVLLFLFTFCVAGCHPWFAQ